MRIALTSIAALMLGCVYSPAELGRYETSDEGTDDPTSGGFGITWQQADLCAGRTAFVDLGGLDTEVFTFGVGVHPVVIEVVPIEPSTLPASLVAEIRPLDGEAAFEVTEMGLRYEGELELGWSLLLHADEQAIVEVSAKSVSSCENE